MGEGHSMLPHQEEDTNRSYMIQNVTLNCHEGTTYFMSMGPVEMGAHEPEPIQLQFLWR